MLHSLWTVQALCLGKVKKIMREGEGKEPVEKPMRLLFCGTHCASDSDASSYWREHWQVFWSLTWHLLAHHWYAYLATKIHFKRAKIKCSYIRGQITLTRNNDDNNLRQSVYMSWPLTFKWEGKPQFCSVKAYAPAHNLLPEKELIGTRSILAPGKSQVLPPAALFTCKTDYINWQSCWQKISN